MRTMTLVAFLSALALIVISACTPVRKVADKPSVDASMLPAGHSLGSKVTVNGAVIYAVVAKGVPTETDYLTLDEAMERKLVTIRETGVDEETDAESTSNNDSQVEPVQNVANSISGDVNTLIISNSGDQPVFLMAGDLLLGGKQDRILSESLIVAPHTKNQPIPVFCVEHGRWAVQSKDATIVEKSGYFGNSKHTGQVDLVVKRAAIETSEQSVVWETVAENNAALTVGAVAQSGTFRSTYDDEETSRKIDTNYEKTKTLAGKGVVGYAVYVEGEMVAMDVFESSGLCGKLSEKLLRSYVITGLSGGYKEEAMVEAETGPMAGENAGGSGPPAVTFPNALGENSTMPSTGQVQTIVLNTARARRVPVAELEDRTISPNSRTETSRAYDKKSVRYDCNDKSTGKPVQRSYMRR